MNTFPRSRRRRGLEIRLVSIKEANFLTGNGVVKKIMTATYEEDEGTRGRRNRMMIEEEDDDGRTLTKEGDDEDDGGCNNYIG